MIFYGLFCGIFSVPNSLSLSRKTLKYVLTDSDIYEDDKLLLNVSWRHSMMGKLCLVVMAKSL